jgi:hypothetical protein
MFFRKCQIWWKYINWWSELSSCQRHYYILFTSVQLHPLRYKAHLYTTVAYCPCRDMGRWKRANEGWKQIPKNQSIYARDKQQRDKKESTNFDLAKPMVKEWHYINNSISSWPPFQLYSLHSILFKYLQGLNHNVKISFSTPQWCDLWCFLYLNPKNQLWRWWEKSLGSLSHMEKFSQILEDQHLSLRKLLWKFKGKCFHCTAINYKVSSPKNVG